MQNNIDKDDLEAVIDLLSSENPKLTHGPRVMEFEHEWSKWLGVKYSVMVNSGSSANDLTMSALRYMRGQGEVIVPPLTWVSDIASVINAGLRPTFVDIDPNTLAMNPKLILDSITDKTIAVFLTHVLGFDGLDDTLLHELKLRDILLIEDVCESHGATHNGMKLGTFGWASNFSFYYAHHLTTIEGGMICTNDANLYELLRMLRSHGLVRESQSQETRLAYQEKYPDLNPEFIFAYPSHNMRPTEINGVMGISQLKRLDDNNSKRAQNLLHFFDLLDAKKYRTDFRIEGNSNYAFTVVLREASFPLRDLVEKVLQEKGVEFRRGLSGGGNQLRQPFLKHIGDFPPPEAFPEVDHMHHFAWYIGNYPDLPIERIRWLCETLNAIEVHE
jgi:CDP-6-deoxy-D-xylo-4-hexulose-3-dehydrase